MVAFYWDMLKAWGQSLLNRTNAIVSAVSVLPGMAIWLREELPVSLASRLPSSPWLGLIPIGAWLAWVGVRANYGQFLKLARFVDRSEEKRKKLVDSRKMWKRLAEERSKGDRGSVLEAMCDVAEKAKRMIQKHGLREGGNWSVAEREFTVEEYEDAMARLVKARAVAEPGFPCDPQGFIQAIEEACRNRRPKSQSELDAARSEIEEELDTAKQALDKAWVRLHGIDDGGVKRPWYEALREANRRQAESE